MPSVVPMSYFSPDETINPGAYTFEIVDANGRANLATIENSSTASKAYAVGDFMVYDGRLRRVTEAITSGGTIVPSGEGANVSQTTFGDEFSNLIIWKAGVAIASTGGASGGTLCTISDPAITENHVLARFIPANPEYIISAKINCTPSAGQVVLTGASTAATTADIMLVKPTKILT